jgi:cell wall-associated NlpC family hydrolase
MVLMVLRNGGRAALAAGALGGGLLLMLGIGTYAASGLTSATGGYGSGVSLAAGTVPSVYQPMIQQASGLCPQLNAPLLAAQLYQESGFNPNAVSGVGAQGIGQVMPGTWALYADKGTPLTNPWDPSQAIPMAARIDCDYARMVANVPGDPQANMLAAYNAGVDPVTRYQGIPPYAETQSYVRSILALAKSFSAPTAPVGISAQANGAIYFAQTKLGIPYEWGGTGLDGRFDCSGLMMAAYASVGITLPRVANDQWYAGPHPSRDQLRPGDLVFFANDLNDPRSIHHVGIYVGGGYMIDAPHTGAQVRYDTIDQTGYIGATRVTQDGAAALPTRAPDGSITGGSALDGNGGSTLDTASPSPAASPSP